MASEPKSPLGEDMVKNGYSAQSIQVQLADLYWCRMHYNSSTPKEAQKLININKRIQQLEAQLK